MEKLGKLQQPDKGNGGPARLLWGRRPEADDPAAKPAPPRARGEGCGPRGNARGMHVEQEQGTLLEPKACALTLFESSGLQRQRVQWGAGLFSIEIFCFILLVFTPVSLEPCAISWFLYLEHLQSLWPHPQVPPPPPHPKQRCCYRADSPLLTAPTCDCQVVHQHRQQHGEWG